MSLTFYEQLQHDLKCAQSHEIVFDFLLRSLMISPKTVYHVWRQCLMDTPQTLLEKQRNGTNIFHHLVLTNELECLIHAIGRLPTNFKLSDDIFLDNSRQNLLMVAVGNTKVPKRKSKSSVSI